MLKIQEDFLHFIWKNRLLKPQPLFTTSGFEITIVRPGEANLNSGPDFFNACIRINNLQLVGNIELHVKSSDWLKHKHQVDKSYDNIILHVVFEHDVNLEQNTNNNVEVLELQSLISEETLLKYTQLFENKTGIPCRKQIGSVDNIRFITWLERMTIERLEKKVERIYDLYHYFNGNYAQTFYSLLLRNFGFHVNAIPFELLAKQLPLNLLLKHGDNIMQLEALLLGTSGMLDEHHEHAYIRALQNEYDYLKTKYKLIPLEKTIFKYSKLRPSNFPTIRLAQFASLVNQQPGLLQNPDLLNDSSVLKTKLLVKPSGYWSKHFTIDGKLQTKNLAIGVLSAEKIIINSFAPFFFFYAKKTGQQEFADLALNFLEACGFESNIKTRLFAAKKEVLKTAGASQALINLYDNYCQPKQCLKCGVAAALLKPT